MSAAPICSVGDCLTGSRTGRRLSCRRRDGATGAAVAYFIVSRLTCMTVGRGRGARDAVGFAIGREKRSCKSIRWRSKS